MSGNRRKTMDNYEIFDEISESCTDDNANGSVLQYTDVLRRMRGHNTDAILYMSRLDSRRSVIFRKEIEDTRKLDEAEAENANIVNPSKEEFNGNRFNDAVQKLKKRKCAKALEQMIRARCNGLLDNESGILKLLNDGVIQSLINLSLVSDGPTQGHCTKALYHLSRCKSTRGRLISSGIISTVITLASSNSHTINQDLCAILCHLSEAEGYEMNMLSDGVERILMRLYRSHSYETKRICALTLFNISCSASSLSRFIVSNIQTIVSLCKMPSPVSALLYFMKALYNISLVPNYHGHLISEGGSRSVVLALRNTDVDIQIMGLKTLLNLCSSRTIRIQIMQDKIVSNVLQCNISKNDELCDVACFILHRLSMEDKNRKEMVQDGSVDAILNVFSKGSSKAYIACSWVLRNLICSEKNNLSNDKIFSLLASMFISEEDEVKFNAMLSICGLCSFEEMEDTTIISLILPVLLSFMADGDENAKRICTISLHNISCSSKNIPSVMSQHNLFTVLKKLLKEADLELVKYAVTILLNLSLVPDKRKLILSNGFFEALLDTLTIQSCQYYSMSIYYNLSFETTIFPEGCTEVKKLVVCLLNLPKKICENTLVSKCLTALFCRLANSVKNHPIMLRSGIILFLSRLSHSDDDMVMLQTAYLINKFVDQLNGVETLLREDGISMLIHLSRASNSFIKEMTAHCFCRMSFYKGLEIKLIDKGVISAVMIIALVATNQESIKIDCAKAICNCLSEKQCVKAMIDAGVLWGLGTLCALENEEVQHACVVSFCNISLVENSRVKMMEAGIPRAIIQLASRTKNIDTAVACMKTISNLLGNEQVCEILIHEGVVKLLRTLFESKEDQIGHSAAQVLLKITCTDDKCRVENLNNGLLSWLRHICTMDDMDLLKNSVVTLHDLTLNPISRDLVDPLETIDLLDDMRIHFIKKIDSEATNSPDEPENSANRLNVHVNNQNIGIGSDDEFLMCKVIYNMSCRKNMLFDLVHANSFNLLKKFFPPHRVDCNGKISNSDFEIIEICTFTTYNLSCVGDDQKSHMHLVSEGVISCCWNAFNHHPSLKKVCALTVANITIGKVNTARIVRESGGIILTCCILEEDLHFDDCRLCSIALRKLVTPIGNQKEMIDVGVTKAFVRILSLAGIDDITAINCLFGLNLLTKVEANLGKIVKDGILSAIVKISNSKNSSSDMLTLCFSILSNLSAIDTDDYQCEDHYNIVATLVKLSECSKEQEEKLPLDYIEKGGERDVFNSEVYTSALGSLSNGCRFQLKVDHSIEYHKMQSKEHPKEPNFDVPKPTVARLPSTSSTLPESLQLPPTQPKPKEALVRDLAAEELYCKNVLRFKGLATFGRNSSALVKNLQGRRKGQRRNSGFLLAPIQSEP